MADYTIVIKACSKIVCHALSRIKTKAILWILFSGFAGLFTVYLYLIFLLCQALLGYLLSVNTQIFSVRTITRCKFHSKTHASSRFDHIFHGYSNRLLTFSTCQHCLSHSTCTMIAIGHISNIIELSTW